MKFYVKKFIKLHFLSNKIFLWIFLSRKILSNLNLILLFIHNLSIIDSKDQIILSFILLFEQVVIKLFNWFLKWVVVLISKMISVLPCIVQLIMDIIKLFAFFYNMVYLSIFWISQITCLSKKPLPKIFKN